MAEFKEASEKGDNYYGFHQAVGAIDGVHVELLGKPSEDPEAYFSRKYRYSILTIAACDWRGYFSCLITGLPGSYHDARGLRYLSFYRNPQLAAEYFGDGVRWQK
jgi:hypothetical protein